MRIARGVAYAKTRDFDRALTDFNKALKLKPDFANAYCNRGIVYGKKGDQDKAINDFTNAIRLRKGYGQAYFNRGVAYSHKGEEAKAGEDFENARKFGYRQQGDSEREHELRFDEI